MSVLVSVSVSAYGVSVSGNTFYSKRTHSIVSVSVSAYGVSVAKFQGLGFDDFVVHMKTVRGCICVFVLVSVSVSAYGVSVSGDVSVCVWCDCVYVSKFGR